MSSLIYKKISLFIIYSLIASSVILPADFSHAQTRSVVGISHPSKVEFWPSSYDGIDATVDQD